MTTVQHISLTLGAGLSTPTIAQQIKTISVVEQTAYLHDVPVSDIYAFAAEYPQTTIEVCEWLTSPAGTAAFEQFQRRA